MNELLKVIPWKRLATWAVVVVVINWLSFWARNKDKLSETSLLAIVILSLCAALLDVFMQATREIQKAKKEKTKNQSTKHISRSVIQTGEKAQYAERDINNN